MIVYSVSTLSRTGSINIGYATETGVTLIGFDCSTWLERWPDMTVEVWVTAPGAASAYEAQTHRRGDVIVWEVLQSDTQTPGAGRVEVIGYTADKRKLSATVSTRIEDSMLMAEGTEPPEAQQPWYTAAQEAKARAEALARHAPIIEDGMWMLWDPDKGAYVNSGVQAQGGSGLPEGAGPWQQLVTGADGVARWEPRLAHAETEEVVILSETTLTRHEQEGTVTFILTEPLAAPLATGMNCEVTYNGTAYKCPVQTVAGEDEMQLALGNVGAATGGEDTGEPFVFTLIPDSVADQMPGVYAAAIPLDDAESVTLAIMGEVEKVSCIDRKYIKDMYGEDVKSTLYLDERNPVEIAVSEYDAPGFGIQTPLAKELEPNVEYVVVVNGKRYKATATESNINGAPGFSLGINGKFSMSLYGEGAESDYHGSITVIDPSLYPVKTVAVYSEIVTVHKMPDKYLPGVPTFCIDGTLLDVSGSNQTLIVAPAYADVALTTQLTYAQGKEIASHMFTIVACSDGVADGWLAPIIVSTVEVSKAVSCYVVVPQGAGFQQVALTFTDTIMD